MALAWALRAPDFTATELAALDATLPMRANTGKAGGSVALAPVHGKIGLLQ